jgi:hypothetical protein
MNLKAITLALFSFISIAIFAQDVNRDGFYAVFASEDVAKIDAEIDVIQKSGDANKAALRGALMMRKAAFLKGNGKKMAAFKEGHKLLEDAIAKNADNTELHLIRLMIQENAPKILKYNKDINDDSQFVKENFKKLSPKLQEVVTGYSKTSKSLSTAQF